MELSGGLVKPNTGHFLIDLIPGLPVDEVSEITTVSGEDLWSLSVRLLFLLFFLGPLIHLSNREPIHVRAFVLNQCCADLGGL